MVVLARGCCWCGCWGQQLLLQLLLPLLRHLRHLQHLPLQLVLLLGAVVVGLWKPQLHPPRPAGPGRR